MADAGALDTPVASVTHLTQSAKEKLQHFVSRMERLAEEKQKIADDMKEIMREAKCFGYDAGAIRHVLRERKAARKSKAAHAEKEQIRDLYMQAAFDF